MTPGLLSTARVPEATILFKPAKRLSRALVRIRPGCDTMDVSPCPMTGIVGYSSPWRCIDDHLNQPGGASVRPHREVAHGME
jgi:hypothetical protein